MDFAQKNTHSISLTRYVHQEPVAVAFYKKFKLAFEVYSSKSPRTLNPKINL